jgi:hypothetical protein
MLFEFLLTFEKAPQGILRGGIWKREECYPAGLLRGRGIIIELVWPKNPECDTVPPLRSA